VFLRTHGIGGLPTLALAAAAASFFAKHGGNRRREIAPRRRHRIYRAATASLASAAPRGTNTIDTAFAATPRFVTPPPLAFGQVSHYAPARVPANRYVPPAGADGVMMPSSTHTTPGTSAELRRSPVRTARSTTAPTSIAASPQLTTPVRGSATVSVHLLASICRVLCFWANECRQGFESKHPHLRWLMIVCRLPNLDRLQRDRSRSQA